MIILASNKPMLCAYSIAGAKMGIWHRHWAKLNPCPLGAGSAEETDKKQADERKLTPGVDKLEKERSEAQGRMVGGCLEGGGGAPWRGDIWARPLAEGSLLPQDRCLLHAE